MMQHADQLDRASEIEAENLRLQLEKQRASRNPELPKTGFCHNCGEPVSGKFCPPVSETVSECQTDFVKRNPRYRQC